MIIKKSLQGTGCADRCVGADHYRRAQHGERISATRRQITSICILTVISKVFFSTECFNWSYQHKWDRSSTAMAALSGGEMCIKYLMFAFNLVFWVSLKREIVFFLKNKLYTLSVWQRESFACMRVRVWAGYYREWNKTTSQMRDRTECSQSRLLITVYPRGAPALFWALTTTKYKASQYACRPRGLEE